MRRSRWIVVGIDFSDGAACALEYALDLASRVGADVACVHAYEDAPGTPAFHDPAPGLRERIEEAVAMRRSILRRVRVEPIVRRGAPWEKLVNVAAELGAELIVVGADGQRGASSCGFLGTVTNRLVASSPRSVVVVPSRAPGLTR
jgi:nucleotide-binding universal stress UspA family protein